MRKISFDGTPRHNHQMRFCDKCESRQPPEGGVQMGPGRWYCASCWIKRKTKESLK